ncbi:uncharacterized protein TrAFT101_011677 [Trichoderma asperellum]|nr:hypothetical protein TrAFT101_011677 [Trichoderma asperellum]
MLQADNEVPEAVKERLYNLRRKLQPIVPPLFETKHNLEEKEFYPFFYDWARDTQEYKRFFSRKPKDLAGDGCRVLWVTGPPGAGKTMLMRATAQGLLEEAKTMSSIDKFNLAYLFCDGRHQPHGYVTQAIKSLIWQILKSQPSLVEHMEEKFRSTGRDTFNDLSDFYAMSTVLYEMIDDSHRDGTKFGLTYVIVDAIDELCVNANEELHTNDDSESVRRYGSPIDDMLRLIKKTAQLSPHIKWLISVDREKVPDDCKEATIGLTPTNEMTLKIDDERYSNHLKDGVIKKYISLKVAELAKRAGFREPFQSQVNAKLSAVAPLNFLWVNMACCHIESHGLPWNATMIPSYAIERVLRGHSASIFSLDFELHGQRLVSSSSDSTVRVWDMSIPQTADAVLNDANWPMTPSPEIGHSTNLSFVAFAPDGGLFASASSDGKICLWDCDTGHIICSFSEHEANIT